MSLDDYIPLQPATFAELLTYSAAEGVQAKVGSVVYVQDGPSFGNNWRITSGAIGALYVSRSLELGPAFMGGVLFTGEEI
jgi:heme oxygenase